MLCFSLDAQIIPDNIKLIGSLRDVKLVDQDDAELTPEALEKVAGGWEKNAESKLLQTIIKKY